MTDKKYCTIPIKKGDELKSFYDWVDDSNPESWKEYVAEGTECTLVKGHKGPHYNYYLGWWAKPLPAEKECTTCKHSQYQHNCWSTAQLDHLIGSLNPHCYSCHAPPVAGHMLNRSYTYTQQVKAKLQQKAQLIAKKPCVTCTHMKAYHKNVEGQWLCMQCPFPMRLHLYDKPFHDNIATNVECKVCSHTYKMHEPNTGHCGICKKLPIYKGKLSEYLLGRHVFALSWYDPGYNDFQVGWLETEERKVLLKHGVDVDEFRLSQACADYYMLERLVADGSKKAVGIQKKREAQIAHSLSTYIEMACGGEGRYAVNLLGSGCYGSGNYSCGGCSDYGCCCMCDDPDEHDDCYEEGYARKNSHYSWDTGPFRDYLDHAGGTDRNSAWSTWMEFRTKYGLDILDQLVDCFYKGGWDGSFGGDSWGLCAEYTRDYLRGNMNAHSYIDRCWTMEHNGGCIFNKVFPDQEISWLMSVLEHQADDNYDYLFKHASEEIRRLWENRKWASTQYTTKLEQVDMFGNMAIRYGWLDRDPTWLGVNLTDREREGW